MITKTKVVDGDSGVLLDAIGRMEKEGWEVRSITPTQTDYDYRPDGTIYVAIVIQFVVIFEKGV